MGTSMREKGKKIVALANQKGGVGKTISAITIASGLAQAGQRVLAIDGDPQGNLSLFFRPAEGADLRDFLIALEGGAIGSEASAFVSATDRKGLDILPLRHKKLRAELPDGRIGTVARAFAETVAALSEKYDWIIIDTSPSDGALERMLVSASQAVVVPLEFQLFSVSGLKAMLDEVESCAVESGREIAVDSLIFTKAENKVGRVSEYREVFATFKIPIYEVCKSEYVPRSIEKGRTLWECAPTSFAARDYEKILERSFLGS